MNIKYPSQNDYNEVIQFHNISVLDEELANGSVRTKKTGLPQVFSGNFAVTYAVDCPTNSYALRCFYRYSANLQERCNEISKSLQKLRSSYFVNFEFIAEGIRVGDGLFPIVKMQWVKGDTLAVFLNNNYKNPTILENLRKSFLDLALFLESKNIAHGDISLENVIVREDGKKLVLIDYDGMFVPNLKFLGVSSEIGNENFQHPLRNMTNWADNLDRFSFHLLDLSLLALQKYPVLYRGDNQSIIFSKSDFLNPNESKVFGKLLEDSQLNSKAQAFKDICKLSSLDYIPKITKENGSEEYAELQEAAETKSKQEEDYEIVIPDIDKPDITTNQTEIHKVNEPTKHRPERQKQADVVQQKIEQMRAGNRNIGNGKTRPSNPQPKPVQPKPVQPKPVQPKPVQLTPRPKPPRPDTANKAKTRSGTSQYDVLQTNLTAAGFDNPLGKEVITIYDDTTGIYRDPGLSIPEGKVGKEAKVEKSSTPLPKILIYVGIIIVISLFFYASN